MKRTLLFFHEGPMITYEYDFNGEYLHIADLNPEAHIQFRLTPIQLLVFGLKCILRSCWR